MAGENGEMEGATGAPVAHYLGMGCFTAVGGFAGGGMIAVLLAKFVGFFTKCAVDGETGAPCNWLTYAFFGAIVGAVVLPTITILLLRRGRKRANFSDRG